MSEFNEVAKEAVCNYLQRREEAVRDTIILVHVKVDGKNMVMAQLMPVLAELMSEDKIETIDGKHYKISSPAKKLVSGKWV